jgi:regulatory protein
VAQKWRVPRTTSNRNIPALNRASLERLALRYLERYATTQAKLRHYLRRKANERGFEGEAATEIDEIVAAFAERRYVDDRGFAEMRAQSLTRKGYGPRRIGQALRAAGIAEEDSREARETAEEEAVKSATAFARRRKLGRFAATPPTPDDRRRAFAAMMRAGHNLSAIKAALDLKDDDWETVDEDL